jgi:hypothetical protein
VNAIYQVKVKGEETEQEIEKTKKINAWLLLRNKETYKPFRKKFKKKVQLRENPDNEIINH